MSRKKTTCYMRFVLIMCLFPLSSGLYQCGAYLSERTGIITTPNFPLPYPVPIRCQWVVQARPHQVIVLYFTQFYMRAGVTATEFSYYSRTLKMEVGKREFGLISSDREPTYLISNKPVLIVDFFVKDRSNMHMRVREYLLDVYGFNITYEVVDANSSSVRNDSCLYHHCSFNGNCYATYLYEEYYCECFSQYFGTECQYDANCGPEEVKKVCQNGGTCRYYIGSTVRTCECPDGFKGARCEFKITDSISVVTGKNMECDNRQLMAVSGYYTYYPQNGICINEGLQRFTVSVAVEITSGAIIMEDELLKDIREKFQSALNESLPGLKNVTFFHTNATELLVAQIFLQYLNEDLAREFVKHSLVSYDSDGFRFNTTSLKITTEPVLSIQRVEASERVPMAEGITLVLACIVQGPASLKVTWYKDGAPIYFHIPHRRIWTLNIPKNSEGQHTSLLGFDRTHVLDTGDFTCSVHEGEESENVTVPVIVRPTPQPQLSLMSATVWRGNALIISCLSKEDVHRNFRYSWLKDGEPLDHIHGVELVEELFPVGSRIVLESIKDSATYTCILSSGLGAARRDSIITVLDKKSGVSPCPANEYWNVNWSIAAPGKHDIQTCPPGYTGFARRLCKKDGKGDLYWDAPDFSTCLTGGLIALQKHFQSLKMGYRLRSVDFLLEKLLVYLQTILPKMRPTEANSVVHLLEEVDDLNQCVYDPESTWKVILDIASLLLRENLLPQSKVLARLHYAILNNSLAFGDFVARNESYFRKTHITSALGVEVVHAPFEETEHMNFSLRNTINVEDPDDDPDIWIMDSVSVRFNGKERSTMFEEGNKTVIFSTIFYRCHIFSGFNFVPSGNIETVAQASVISGIVSITILSQNKPWTDDILVTLYFRHEQYNTTDGYLQNVSCAIVDFARRFITDDSSLCNIISSRENFTICQCQGANDYTLVTIARKMMIVETERKFKVEVMAGCICCILSLLITIIVLLYRTKKSQVSMMVIKLHVCVSLLLMQTALMFKIGLPECKICRHLLPAAVFLIFVLVAVTFQTCLVLLVYMEVKNIRPALHPCFVAILTGWGFPTLTCGCAAIVKATCKTSSDKLWLMKYDNAEFYIFISSVLVITMIHVALIVAIQSLKENHENRLEVVQQWMNKIRLTNVSIWMHISIVSHACAAIAMFSHDHYLTEYAFTFTSISLSLTVLVCYIFYSEKF